MFRRSVVILLTLFFSFGVLTVSVLSAATPNKAYSGPMVPSAPFPKLEGDLGIPYWLPFPGKILPDNSLWIVKAIRDRVEYLLAGDPGKKSEVALLLSDKRLASSVALFEKNKPFLALEVLGKGEKYLEEAASFESVSRSKGIDTTAFLIKLAQASLKHREIMESLLTAAPEDMKPDIVKTRDYSINVYKIARDALLAKGIPSPDNPFESN